MSLPVDSVDDGAEPVKLILPASPESLVVARAVVATLAARADLTLDDIDDAMIATEEAALAVMGHSATQLTIEVSIAAGNLKVSATSDGDPASWRHDDVENGLGWRILRGVTDHVGSGAGHSGPTVWFEKRVDAAIG